MNKIMKNQRGAAMIEFAIVLPLLLTLTLGVIEFGNVLMTFNTLNKMTMDAARYLSIYSKQGNGTYSISSSDKTKAFNLINCGNETTCATSSPNDHRFLKPPPDPNLFTVAVSTSGIITVGLTYNYQSPFFTKIFNTTIIPSYSLVSNATIQAL